MGNNIYVWKKKGELILDRTILFTVKYGGGNMMVWATKARME